MTIFGREPAALVAAIQSLLIVAVSFGWLEAIGLSSQDDVMLVVAVLSALGAVFLAWKTTGTVLSPVLELFKALLAVAAIYGFSLSTEQTGAAVAAITMVIGLFQRTQVTPLADGNFDVRT